MSGFRPGLALSLGMLLLCAAAPAWAQGSRGGFFPGSGAASHGSPVRDIFSLLFGGLRSASRYGEPDRPRIILQPRARDGVIVSGGNHAYCVRTCDGRFFPLQGRAGDTGDALAQCNAFCPAARMAVYTTSDSSRGIDGAVTREGKAYTELPTAYVFRQRLVEGCTCTAGTRVGGLGAVDVKDDPTLRRGDIVMTQEGGRVFAGGRKGPPYRDEDFVPPARFPDLPRDMRARLSELEVASR
ncbi:DUF2865 domain-containing protein [Xanthobacter sp. V3C-3]|uniref:DUF2865 domain-containing protein n=1 Tax=Xanthobacter lutulentifluminis TaxID=3119935 RepID=UPI003726A93C